MTYDEIIEEAKKDSLDPEEFDLSKASLMLPNLHQKWSMILMEEKLRLRKHRRTQDKWLRIMWEYYSGKLSQEELIEYDLPQFQTKLMKNVIDKYLNSDEKLNDMEDVIQFQTNVVDLVDRKLKEIMNRQWNIRAAIDHRKFMSGG